MSGAPDKIMAEANLYGKTFGPWRVLAHLDTVIVAERGIEGGKGAGWAKRARWVTECVVCRHRRDQTTNQITHQPYRTHRPCRKAYQAMIKDELKRDAAALFGGR